MRDEKKNMRTTAAETTAAKPGLMEVASMIARDVKEGKARFADKKVSLTAAIIWGLAACVVTLGLTLHAVNNFGLAEVVKALPQRVGPDSVDPALAVALGMVYVAVLTGVLTWVVRVSRQAEAKQGSDRE